MSNRDGMREHFTATIQTATSVASINVWEINTLDARRAMKAKLKLLNANEKASALKSDKRWTFVTGKMTNLNNGRSLKI